MYSIYFDLCNSSILLCFTEVPSKRTGTFAKKLVLSIINPGLTYHEALSESNIPTIMSYGDTICRTFFDSAVNDKYNKLNKLLPPIHETTYQLRQNRRFDIPNWSTNRFRDTFIMASAINNGC